MESPPVAIRTTTSVENGHVQEVVRRAHQELCQLFEQRAEIMRRIRIIKRTIDGLAYLVGDVVLGEGLPELAGSKSSGRRTGLTKACRMILTDANRALTARDVSDRIHEKLPSMLEGHKNPTNSVTTVLNRLVAYGEARAVTLENGRRAWKWISDSEPESVPASGLAP